MTNAATLWKDGRFYDDEWHYLESGISSGKVILSAAEWLSGDWKNHEGKLGLSLSAGDDIASLSQDFDSFDLIVVNFPSFANGTAFSIARLIRDRHGFEGEIRAAGAYILDQMPMLLRCGVDHFEISSDAIRAGLNRGAWPDLPRYYQHALDGKGNAARTRTVDPKRPWVSENVTAGVELERQVA